MRIKNEGVLRRLRMAILRKQVTACKKLRESYQDKTGLTDCPLCPIVSDRCTDCPWMYIKGVYCHDWVDKDIVGIRINPIAYSRYANLRVIALTKWIDIINAEITRRSKNGKKRIAKTGKKS